MYRKEKEEQKYTNLIKQLLNLKKKFEQSNFNFLRTFLTANSVKDRPLHYFFFCVDVRYLYYSNPLMQRMTLYDIFTSTNTINLSKRESELNIAYECLKALFDGKLEIEISNKKLSFNDIRRKITNQLSVGLAYYDIEKATRKKNVYEVIDHIFNELSNVDYEVSDYKKSYLPDEEYRSSKVLIYLFKRFQAAVVFTELYKKKYGLQVDSMQLSEQAVLHILLRHVVPFKILNKKLTTNEGTIKNGLGIKVSIKAIKDKEGYISVIGSDGNFFLPFFSTKEKDYFKLLCSGQPITNTTLLVNIDYLHNLLQQIVRVLEVYNKPSGTIIVYLNGELYGVEINTHKEDNSIESIYPLNSEAQQQFGVDEEDLHNIINLVDVPRGYIDSLQRNRKA